LEDVQQRRRIEIRLRKSAPRDAAVEAAPLIPVLTPQP
jgi:hypothetical protein